VNDIAKVSRNGRTQQISLPEAFQIEGDSVRVRREGRSIVLDPILAGTQGEVRVPPGTYTPETLPPLSDGAKAILASVEAAASRPASPGKAAARLGGGPPGITLEDEGAAGISLSDEGLPGFDPDH
jgi:hypothetical protein